MKRMRTTMRSLYIVILLASVVSLVQCSESAKEEERDEISASINLMLLNLDTKIEEVKDYERFSTNEEWSAIRSDLEESRLYLERRLKEIDTSLDTGWDDYKSKVNLGIKKANSDMQVADETFSSPKVAV